MEDYVSKNVLIYGCNRTVSIYAHTPCPPDEFIPKEDKFNILVSWPISAKEAKIENAVEFWATRFIPKHLNFPRRKIVQNCQIFHLPNRSEKNGENEYFFQWEIHLRTSSPKGTKLFVRLRRIMFA